MGASADVTEWVWKTAGLVLYKRLVYKRLGAAACALAYVARCAEVRKFEQPVWSALAHPVGVLGLTLIQWQALGLHLAGKRSAWKGRSYGDANAGQLAES